METNLLGIIEQKSYGIDMGDVETLRSMIDQGLQVVAICVKGRSRSYAMASFLCTHGVEAVAIDGGLNGLAELDEVLRSDIINGLSSVPLVIFTIDEDFEAGNFESIIEQIKTVNSNVVISTNYTAILNRF